MTAVLSPPPIANDAVPSATGRLLILSASTGSGHMSAARALAEAFELRYPGVSARVVDVLTLTNPLFRHLYADGYRLLCNQSPRTMGWLYERTDSAADLLSDRFRRGFQWLNTRSIARFIRREQPDLIMHTHFLPAEVIGRMAVTGGLHCPHVTVCTDLETHRLWVQPATERYFTATTLGRDYLREWGVSADRISVTGIPIRVAFADAPERMQARARHGLDSTRPFVLMLGTGCSRRTVAALLRQAARLPERVQRLVITGHDYRGETHGIPTAAYSDQLATLMRAADVLVTKPGGLTTSEALVAGPALLLISPIPGQESRNSDYLLEHGAAIRVNNLKLLPNRVLELVEQPDCRQRLAAAAARLARPTAAVDIASATVALLSPTTRT